MGHLTTSSHLILTTGFKNERSDVSMDQVRSMETSNRDCSMSMSKVGSSFGSNSSAQTVLMHPELRTKTGTTGSVAHSVMVRYYECGVIRPSVVTHAGFVEDTLRDNLMDSRYPTEGLEGYEQWTIDLRRLDMGPPFAQGAFGRLYRGAYDAADVAIKILERPETDLRRALSMESQFAKEATMLANTKHPNVVRFIGACRKPMVWCIVTEYARGGSVRKFLSRSSRPAPLQVVVNQALDVARGMEYLHSLEIIHRDLKSDNLLIANDNSIKIADFGFARFEVQNGGMTPETGTYRWMAPEMMQHIPYNHKVDVYSFGIVLWELLTGLLPFQSMTAVQAASAVLNKGMRPTIPDDCPPTLVEVMCRCWDSNPDIRPSFGQVVRMLEEAKLVIMSRARVCCRFIIPD